VDGYNSDKDVESDELGVSEQQLRRLHGYWNLLPFAWFAPAVLNEFVLARGHGLLLTTGGLKADADPAPHIRR
jgi:hypothetical protein